MIRIDDVTYWYPEAAEAALRSLSLSFKPGEAVCVMGRNGSGKTTLFKLIAGLITPTRGKIAVNGQVAASDNGRAQVAILFQNPENQMVATVVEKEIAFALENLARPPEEMEAVIAGVAGRFGINHLLDRITSELSGGEMQRVALASIMVCDPPVLLLDEPDAFLDEAGRTKLRQELDRLHRDRPELVELRITQSPSVARTYPRLLVIEAGSLVYDGPPGPFLGSRPVTRGPGSTADAESSASLALPELFTSHTTKVEAQLSEVVLEEVGFAYPGCDPILREINLSFRPGDRVALVGPTGSGKSSLGLLLCGVTRPTWGALRFLGTDGSSLDSAAVRGQIVAILQQPERQFFLETCAKEIAFGPSNLGRPLNLDQIESLLEWSGLPASRFAARDPFTLSAGEKRRLALAAVLAMTPSMVVFDEPTAGLDPDGVAWFFRLSDGLAQAGVGQMIITHDGDLVQALSRHVLCLKPGGRLTACSTQDFFCHPELAGLVSAPQAQS